MGRENSKLIVKQIESVLSQRLYLWYNTYLEHLPTQVIFQLFDNNKIAIIVENAIPRPVQLLVEHGKDDLAKQIRMKLDRAMLPQLKELIEEVVGVSVIDLLIDTNLETARSGIIAILSAMPLLSDRLSMNGQVNSEIIGKDRELS